MDPAVEIAIANAFAEGIKALISWYEKAKQGAITPDQALAGFKSLTDTIASDDAIIRSDIDKKFPG